MQLFVRTRRDDGKILISLKNLFEKMRNLNKKEKQNCGMSGGTFLCASKRMKEEARNGELLEAREGGEVRTEGEGIPIYLLAK